MKNKSLLIVLVFLFAKISAGADVIPDPVVAKGIIPSHPVSIQMVSELVKVNLTPDSAFVECTFHMHNWGNRQDLEVGFPVMNFYLWQNDYLSPLSENRFDVLINGTQINKVNIYIPDTLKKLFSGVDPSQRYDVLRVYGNLNKPWYLWKMHFKAGENETIVVKYRLPNGGNKSNMFFDYLLSTGAGWKGKIEDAKIVVNLDGIPRDQVLSVSPKRFVSITLKQITWHFKDLKPNLSSDILIEYEHEKGQHKAFLEQLDLTPTYLDDRRVKYSSVDTSRIGDMNFRRDKTSGEEEIVFFTKAYILRKFKQNLKSKDFIFWQQISKLSVQNIERDYFFEVNGRAFETGIFEKLNEIDTIKKITGKISSTTYGRKKIVFISTSPP